MMKQIKFSNRLYLFVFVCLGLLYTLIKVESIFAQGNIIYDEKGKRDPFFALVTPDGRLINLNPVEADKKLKLEGIYYEKEEPSYAIINNEIVSEGDNVLGYTVIKIEQNKVLFMKDNETVEYRLDDVEFLEK